MEIKALIDALSIAQELYGITCMHEPLTGYSDKNFLLKTPEGEKYVLKLSRESSPLLDAQNSMLEYLGKHSSELKLQKVIAKGERKIFQKEISGTTWNIRLLTYLEGTFFATIKHTPDLLVSLGKYLGKLTNSLQGFFHPEFKARTLEWDIRQTLLSKKYLEYIPDPNNRKWVQYFMLQFQELVVPELENLRQSVIYGDANDWNILVDENQVIGVIDFGDSVYTPVINELAIAITYAIMEKEEPLLWASFIVNGFHSEFPLKEKEISLLYYLIAARLCISVCQSAKSIKENPANDYITISEKPAWNLIKKWGMLNPIKARDLFLQTCEFSIPPKKSIDELSRKRDTYISKSLSLSYTQSIHMERAAFQYMYDAGGNTYLDLVNNIMHVGHCHPKVVEAGQRQMAKLNTNTRYHYELLTKYTSHLCRFLPPALNKIFLVNSGSAASDLAIRLAMRHTGRGKVMVMDHGYHGNTMMGIEISPYKYQGKGGFPQSDRILKASLPDLFRSKDKSVSHYISEAKSMIDKNSESLSAFIVEPIVGCGGQVPLPVPFLKEIFEHLKSKGGVAIADEVQTGFGRAGTHFWAFEQQGAQPDIVVMGKPMGNGHPLAAVATTSAIAESFENGMEFFSSFGGNPVSCAIGDAVLYVIEEEELQTHALRVGEELIKHLSELMKVHPGIGDIRGTGLFLGIELIENENLDPATDFAKKLINRMKDCGILLSTDGPYNNVIKIKPPMCLTSTDLEYFVENLDKELRSLR